MSEKMNPASVSTFGRPFWISQCSCLGRACGSTFPPSPLKALGLSVTENLRLACDSGEFVGDGPDGSAGGTACNRSVCRPDRWAFPEERFERHFTQHFGKLYIKASIALPQLRDFAEYQGPI